MDRVGGLICLLINSLSLWERAGVRVRSLAGKYFGSVLVFTNDDLRFIKGTFAQALTPTLSHGRGRMENRDSSEILRPTSSFRGRQKVLDAERRRDTACARCFTSAKR